MMIVNYHGFFGTHSHYCDAHAAHRGNCANHRSD